MLTTQLYGDLQRQDMASQHDRGPGGGGDPPSGVAYIMVAWLRMILGGEVAQWISK